MRPAPLTARFFLRLPLQVPGQLLEDAAPEVDLAGRLPVWGLAVFGADYLSNLSQCAELEHSPTCTEIIDDHSAHDSLSVGQIFLHCIMQLAPDICYIPMRTAL